MIDLVSLGWVVLTAQASKMSLDDAIQIALVNSFSVKNANATVRSNEERLREAKGATGPRISSNYQYLRYGREQTGNIGGANVVFQPLDLNTWTNQLALPIDVAGAFRSSINSAKAGVESSRNTVSSQENDVKLQVRKAYINVLRTKSLQEVAVQGRKNIEARLEQAEKQYKAGLLAKIDVDRLKSQIASEEANVIAAGNNLTIAKQALNLALSRPIETDFDVNPIAPVSEVANSSEELVKIGQYLRPEVKSIENSVVALGAAKRFAESGLLPSLNLSLQNQQTLDPAGFNPQREINTTVLQLSVPLYDSGVARAKRKQTEEQIEQTKNNLQSLNLAISQEVRAAKTNMANAMARQKAASEQISFATEVVRIARVRRNAGEGTTLEIIDAETQFVQAQNNQINATYDFMAAYADLQRAIGYDNIQDAVQFVQRTQAESDPKSKAKKPTAPSEKTSTENPQFNKGSQRL